MADQTLIKDLSSASQPCSKNASTPTNVTDVTAPADQTVIKDHLSALQPSSNTASTSTHVTTAIASVGSTRDVTVTNSVAR